MEQRIIKFKAKRLDNGKWVSGYFYQECGSTYIIEDRQSESVLKCTHPFKVDPSTVCQYTGLKDCEGNEVWEHDVFVDEYDGKCYEVVYVANDMAFALMNMEDNDDFQPLNNLCFPKLLYSKFDEKDYED